MTLFLADKNLNYYNLIMDVELFREMGKEFKKRFEGKNINKIMDF